MRLVFTVTNDLTYDQRMHRIAGSLAAAGYEVLLVGRHLPHSIPLTVKAFEQKRLRCFFRRGALFYAEYNLRLFFFLLRLKSFDVICSIDFDTLVAGYFASVLRRKKRVFDAHEYFTEVPELAERPFVRSVWKWIGDRLAPQYRYAYTVGPRLAQIFSEQYGVPFEVIRNLPLSGKAEQSSGWPELSGKKILLYQGALNAGRGIEQMLEAMLQLEGICLVLAGEGDLSAALRQKAEALQLKGKVVFLGYVEPQQLKSLSALAWAGINLLENKGLSYYYSLANKYFDYVQAGVPVITMQFPEYEALNQEFEVARLLPALEPDAICAAVQSLSQAEIYTHLQNNCHQAAKVWNWENEEKVLLAFWSKVTARS